MSAPIGDREQDLDKIDEALLYAPPWARQRPPEDGRAARFANSPPMAPGVGGPNIDPPAPRRFTGDVAAEALRHQLSLDPVLMPEPPIALREDSWAGWLGRLAIMVVLAATVTFTATWLVLPGPTARDRSSEGEPTASPARPALAVKSPRLVVESQRGYANEPLALGVLLDGKANGETLLLQGLSEGTRLSVGSAFGRTAWRLPAAELGNVVAYAPQNFIGTMDARADLRSTTDRLIDSQGLTLEWIGKKADRHVSLGAAPQAAAAPKPIADEEMAALHKRAQDFLKSGDIASARLLLRRAANGGSADAALALGATFEDDFLAELGVLGFTRDVEQARSWYQKAAQMGSAEAARRLQRLESSVK